jgi:histidyl-tRNA synthetase
LELNSLGSDKIRDDYRQDLVKYLTKYKDSLSEDSQKRLVSNPLRILDSKDKKDQEILSDAKSIADFYDDREKGFLDNILKSLEARNIKYKVNPKLVRGLDYYTKTVFEFTTDKLGSQNAVFAGGRYDKLVEQMGGKSTPAIGFAGGMERVSELMAEQESINDLIMVTAIDQDLTLEADKILQDLRNNNLNSDGFFKDLNFAKKLKKISKYEPKYVVILGQNEWQKDKVKIKDFTTSKEVEIDKSKIIEFFK